MNKNHLMMIFPFNLEIKMIDTRKVLYGIFGLSVYVIFAFIFAYALIYW